MKYFIANWKAHKTLPEAATWLIEFIKRLDDDHRVLELLHENKIHIIIAPPYTYLFPLKKMLPYLPNLSISAQDCSAYDDGSYTGEITASMISNAAKYCIVGHSERRRLFHETEETIRQKLNLLTSNKIKSILCIRNEQDTIYESASIVAYEPVDAIGSGHNKAVNEVIEIKKTLSLKPHQQFLYGGSVNPEDCKAYIANNEINGLLIGKASLDADTFFSIVSSVV